MTYSSLKILHEVSAQEDCFDQLPDDLKRLTTMNDPSVWPVLLTTHSILRAITLQHDVSASQISMLVCGNVYPALYAKKVLLEVQNKRRVSPLSFINANAGAAISVCCTTFHFQGPSLNLTMPSENGEQFAEILIKKWLNNKDANYVFWVSTKILGDDRYEVRNRLVSI